MRLWTIQDEAVYNTIITEGKYRCDGSKSVHLESDKFKKAYAWLVKKMEEKLGQIPDGIEYPVWAWAFKPDLRKSCWCASGKKCVRIEFEIDEKDIFITDYGNWHCALNDFPFFDIEDDDEWEKVYREFCLLRGDDYTKALEKSWEGFIYSEIPSNEHRAQITFWELKKEQIKKVHHFISR